MLSWQFLSLFIIAAAIWLAQCLKRIDHLTVEMMIPTFDIVIFLTGTGTVWSIGIIDFSRVFLHDDAT